MFVIFVGHFELCLNAYHIRFVHSINVFVEIDSPVDMAFCYCDAIYTYKIRWMLVHFTQIETHIVRKGKCNPV